MISLWELNVNQQKSYNNQDIAEEETGAGGGGVRGG